MEAKANVEPQYRRLRGSGLRHQGFLSLAAMRHTVWMGEDHLLSVDLLGITERYKRFYFRDIQSIIVRPTSRGKKRLQSLGLLLAVGLLLVILGLQSRPEVPRVLGLVIGIPTAAVCAPFFLMELLQRLFYGQTCVCHVQTAVQTEELPALSRKRHAQRALEALRSRILSAQGVPEPGSAAEPAGPVGGGVTAPPGAPAKEGA